MRSEAAAGVGDRGGRLRGEQDEDLLVLTRELFVALLRGEEEAAHVHVPMPHRRALQGLVRQHAGGKAERAEVGGEVRDPQRARKVPEAIEQPRSFGPLTQLPVLLPQFTLWLLLNP